MVMRMRRKIPVKWIVTAVIVLLAAAYLLIESIIAPSIMSLAEPKLKAIAVSAMNEAVREIIAEGNITYSDLIELEKDEEGNISLINSNTMLMNKLAVDTAAAAQKNILSAGQQGISVPIGTLFGGPIFTGRGPAITVKFEPTGSVTTNIKDELDAAGINQTRHKIYVILNAQVRILIGSASQTVEVSSQVLISETIIVGKVPQTYLQFLGGSDGMLNLLPGSKS